MDKNNEELEKIRDELEKKWRSIRLAGGVNKAPAPLSISARNLEFLLAKAEYNSGILTLEDLVYELKAIDNKYAPMLSPKGDYLQYEKLLQESGSKKI
jgi:hypothetical protein